MSANAFRGVRGSAPHVLVSKRFPTRALAIHQNQTHNRQQHANGVTDSEALMEHQYDDWNQDDCHRHVDRHGRRSRRPAGLITQDVTELDKDDGQTHGDRGDV